MLIDPSRLHISYRVNKGKAISFEEQALLLSIMEEVIQRVNENNAQELDQQTNLPKQA